MSAPTPPLDVLIRKLESISDLGALDKSALAALPVGLKVLEVGQDLLLEGDRPSHCCILLDGWMCRRKGFAEGHTQILSLHIVGDLVDLQSLNLPVMDHTVTALTRVHLACVSHANMRELLRSESLNNVLWRSILVEGAVTRQWLLNIGQRSAQQRIAHLICELFKRLEAVASAWAFGSQSGFQWPLTQTLLGQAVGVSTVHVNRSLQAMRSMGLIEVSVDRVTIVNWLLLQEFAGFDESYLSLI